MATPQPKLRPVHREADVAHVYTLSLSGTPGCGMTTLLEETLRRIGTHYRAGVIVGDPAAVRDTRRLQALAARVLDIPSIELDAARVKDAAAQLAGEQFDVLFIESSPSLSVPPMELGQDARVSLFSIAAGDDKAARFPQRIRAADLVLLNKIDLAGQVAFDTDVFLSDARRINPDVTVMALSAARGEGMDLWVRWLRGAIKCARTHGIGSILRPPEWFLG